MSCDLRIRLNCRECEAARNAVRDAELEAEAIELANVTQRILRSASTPAVAFAALTGVLEALAKDAGRKPIDVARDLVKSFE